MMATLPPILTKRTATSHIISLNIEKKLTTYDVGHPVVDRDKYENVAGLNLIKS